MKIRKPAVAGRFYPSTKHEIENLIEEIYQEEKKHIKTELSEKEIIGGIVPHAGYIFSAYQAVHFFDILRKSKTQYDTFIIINPSHTGFGAEISLDDNDAWETPLGLDLIDEDFMNILSFDKSSIAHNHEHSGEVMLPFLQYFLNYEYKILPISINNQNKKNAEKVANAIFEANKILNKKICIIASSDFSHFLTPKQGEKLDNLVLEKIKNFDIQGVYNEVTQKNISICGFAPIMSLMNYSQKTSKNSKNVILKKGHSGEIMPSETVVNYVSMLFYNI